MGAHAPKERWNWKWMRNTREDETGRSGDGRSGIFGEGQIRAVNLHLCDLFRINGSNRERMNFKFMYCCSLAQVSGFFIPENRV